MRIESASSALTFGNNYKPRNAAEAKEELPQMKKQLAQEEQKLAELLKQFDGFSDSHKLITSTSGKGGNFDAMA